MSDFIAVLKCLFVCPGRCFRFCGNLKLEQYTELVSYVLYTIQYFQFRHGFWWLQYEITKEPALYEGVANVIKSEFWSDYLRPRKVTFLQHKGTAFMDKAHFLNYLFCWDFHRPLWFPVTNVESKTFLNKYRCGILHWLLLFPYIILLITTTTICLTAYN